MTKSLGAKGMAGFLYLSLAVLAGLVVFLSVENRSLEAQLYPEVPGLEAGEAAPVISAVTLEGEVKNFHWTEVSRERLLLVFTTTCSVCQKNQGVWRTLFEELGPELEFWGISLDLVEPTVVYREVNGLPFPILLPKDRQIFADAYKVSVVPTTIHIGSDGRIRRVWSGALSQDQVAELKADLATRTARG